MMQEITLPNPLYMGGRAYKIESSTLPIENTNYAEHSAASRTLRFHMSICAIQGPTCHILHEVLHAISAVFCQGKELDEAQVCAVEEGLLQFFNQLGIQLTIEGFSSDK